jgi:hypothetical protein
MGEKSRKDTTAVRAFFYTAIDQNSIVRYKPFTTVLDSIVASNIQPKMTLDNVSED